MKARGDPRDKLLRPSQLQLHLLLGADFFCGCENVATTICKEPIGTRARMFIAEELRTEVRVSVVSYP